MKKKRCVIVGAAPIGDYERIKSRLSPSDFIIYCDGGLYHEERLGKTADLIIGDFDSHEMPVRDTEIIVLPHVKDDTDTFYAAKEAVKRGFGSVLLVGVIGGRLDHTLGNVSILLYLHSLGIRAEASDDFSDMCVVSEKPEYVDNNYSYFSLLNVTGTAEDITVKGALYELDRAKITCEYPLGVSNEVKGERAEISVGRGKLLLIKDI